MVNCLIDAGVDVNYELHSNSISGEGSVLASLKSSDELFETVLAAGASDRTMDLAISRLNFIVGEGHRRGGRFHTAERDLEILIRKLEDNDYLRRLNRGGK